MVGAKPFPNWAKEDYTENEKNVKKFGPKPFPDWAIEKKSNSIFPDWAIEPTRSKNRRKKKDWNELTSIEIYNYRKTWLLRHGYKKLLDYESSPSLVYHIYDQVKYILRVYKKLISPDKLGENILLMREFEEEKKIRETATWFVEQYSNNILPINFPQNFELPKASDFNFPKYAESDKYVLSHIFFDIENKVQDQTPLKLGVFNLEAGRVILGFWDKSRKETLVIPIAPNIYYIETPNLMEALLLADIETVLAVISTSALMSGHNNLISLFDNNEFNIFRLILINPKLYEEILCGVPQRRSLWIGHNLNFDINMIHHTAQKVKNILPTLPDFRVNQISLFMGQPQESNDNETNTKAVAYTIKLGNTVAGFRSRINFNPDLGAKGIPTMTLHPLQEKTFSYIWVLDTFILSLALQNPKHSLKELSKGTKYEKLDSNYLFTEEDFIINENSTDLSKADEYLCRDLFATCAVCEKLMQTLNYPELAKLLDIIFSFSIKPVAASTFSTATIAKRVIFANLEKKTGLTKKQIENNIISERKYQKNWEKVNNGGRNELFVHGAVFSTPEEPILYPDFEQLYPSIARCTYADDQYTLASKKELSEKYVYDIESLQRDFWKNVKIIVECMKHLQPLPDNIFRPLIGTATINTNEVKLFFRGTTPAKRKCDEYVEGIVHRNLISITSAVVRAIIEDKHEISYLKKRIIFLKTQRIDFDYDPPAFGEEFFTKIVGLRREKKKEIMSDGSIGNPIEKMLKYTNVSGFGISGEGIRKEDYTGKLNIPSIFGSITAGSEFLTSIAEMTFKYYDNLSLYTDTDSDLVKGQKKIIDKILTLFANISELKYETDYGEILAIYIAKKKKYGILAKNINTKKLPFLKFVDENDQELFITGKTHGISQYPSYPFEQSIFNIYKDILYSKTKVNTAIQNHKNKFPLFSKLSYNKDKNSKIRGILPFFNKSITRNFKKQKKIYSVTFPHPNSFIKTLDFTYNGFTFKINVIYNWVTNLFLFTNLTEKLIKANFGLYANLGNIRVFLTIPVDITSEEYYIFEKQFLQVITEFFNQDNFDEIFFTVTKTQALGINKIKEVKNELYNEKIIRRFLKYDPETGKNKENNLTKQQLMFRVNQLVKNNKLIEYSKTVYNSIDFQIKKLRNKKNIFVNF
ncbi:MAG: hypothetical protein HeimC3_44430, partial [Candidatus Heimdallarchaeota archaeon LC_3]